MFENGVIVIGTDTGVGKTFIAAGLLCALRLKNKQFLPMKPVQTGALPDGRSPDLDFCLASAGIECEPSLYDRLAPYRFSFPASPHLAARMENAVIDPERILMLYRGLREDGYSLLVEAAGGLLVPWKNALMQADALLKFELPFVLVARAGLGTLNHTLLSVEALRARKAHIARIYLNATADDHPVIEEDNAHTLARLLPDIQVRRIPRQADPSPHVAADLFSASGV